MVKAEQKNKRESQVTMYRKYRSGHLPDIQIKYSCIIAPLQAIAHVSICRIQAVLKGKTDIITSISASPVGRAVILVIMSVQTFKTYIIVFICKVIMCLISH
jgi:DNA-dependent protein kinase catalytic subunit